MTEKTDKNKVDQSQTDQTLEAVKELLTRHGIRRTSMNDIAEAAGVSRQTLYSRFESKEGILRAVIFYSTDQTIGSVKDEWLSCKSVADKLDVFFRHAIITTYELMETMPDAADLFAAEHPMVSEAIQDCEKKYTQLVRSMLLPCADILKERGETPASVASLITTTGYAMKHNATSVTDLNKKLLTLRRMVVLTVGEEAD